MDPDDTLLYANLANYVRNSLPDVIAVPAIVQNLWDCGRVSKAKLRHALAWGNDPLIVIRDLAAGTCGLTEALGCFDGTAPHRIELDRGAAGAFEADKFGLGSAPNASGRGVFVVGATLLHELCHWGNFHAGRAEAREWGEEFERRTYGQRIQRPPVIIFEDDEV
jgi:hypothetical protein